MTRRLLLVAATTGYQTRAFGEAAARAGVELVFATDRCDRLDDPWRDAAVAVRFHEEDAAVAAVVEAAAARPLHGVLAVGDRPARIAALAAAALGLPGHPPDAVAISRDKLAMRRCFEAAGLAVPWFRGVARDADPRALVRDVPFPCVLKPSALSGSRGVIRADDGEAFMAAFTRIGRLLAQSDVRAMRDPLQDRIVVEAFVPGREIALEGLMAAGRLRTLALFDKPDPLEGPYFEETIYLTPSALDPPIQEAVRRTVARAASAMGLRDGPVHAECRIAPDPAGSTVTVLEIAARPIGGLCARALRFAEGGRDPTAEDEAGHVSLEELLLRHALAEPTAQLSRERTGSGVMMMPIPRGGVFRGVSGVEAARQVPGVTDVRITAKPDQQLVPLPEGASYLGFLFARAPVPADVERALRTAHARLEFRIDRAMVVE